MQERLRRSDLLVVEGISGDSPVAEAFTMTYRVMREIHRTRADERIVVAVVYGAGQVPAGVHGLLDRHGYRVRTAEWLTVVSG